MNQKPVDDTPKVDDHEHVYICQDCGEIGTSIKPVDDKELDDILDSYYGSRDKAYQVGCPHKPKCNKWRLSPHSKYGKGGLND